jgi:hypothetical protein
MTHLGLDLGYRVVRVWGDSASTIEGHCERSENPSALFGESEKRLTVTLGGAKRRRGILGWRSNGRHVSITPAVEGARG